MEAFMDGVRVMVKIKDPKIFDVLDRVSMILKNQMKKEGKLISQF